MVLVHVVTALAGLVPLLGSRDGKLSRSQQHHHHQLIILHLRVKEQTPCSLRVAHQSPNSALKTGSPSIADPFPPKAKVAIVRHQRAKQP
ncbi:hypothetical protein B0T17DRAFT_31952 [Bombardia bombarda]|uniref:Secreted protein n=1 Tax=Bombardia bombarda TaxID=252184 RepID=A0AA40CF49_9PEZI|nr:hypothetical protein B0T17DRAFT_31952 [Bombardia bombarda]